MNNDPPRPMLPVRHRPHLFSLDIASISLKDVQQQMEFPFFSLSKHPDLTPRRYEDRHGNSLEVTPSVKGLPTIYDKDFLICAISQVMDRLNRGEPASRRLILYASDMLEFANRTKGGKDYRALDDAITRLRGCTVRTNIRTGDIYRTSIFGMVESGDLVRKYGFDGRLQHVELTLSEWLWAAIEARQVLTLHPDYFRLRQPLERRIYEIGRKHCGQQAEWRIGLDLLHRKSGSKGNRRLFRQAVRRIAAAGDLLDYGIAYDPERDTVTFRRREGSLVAQPPAADGGFTLPPSVAEEARRRFGAGTDLAAAERDWRAWLERRGLRPTNPAPFFLSFLATWTARQGGAAPAAAATKSDWIQETAAEWWAALTEAERQAWRDHLGARVVLSDGEGWFRSEESFAVEAFRARYWHQRVKPHEYELPPQLLARAAEMAPPGVGTEDIERGWRKWIRSRTYLHDRPIVSVLPYAMGLANAKPDGGSAPTLPGLGQV